MVRELPARQEYSLEPPAREPERIMHITPTTGEAPEALEASLNRCAHTVQALDRAGLCTQIEVVARDGRLWTRDSSSTTSAAEAVRRAQARQPTGQDAAEWLGQYKEVFRRAERREGHLGHMMRTYRQLQADELEVLATSRLAPSDRHQVVFQHSGRDRVLDRVALS